MSANTNLQMFKRAQWGVEEERRISQEIKAKTQSIKWDMNDLESGKKFQKTLKYLESR